MDDFSDYRDLALADLAQEVVALEDSLVDAVFEGVVYRGMLMLALDRWEADRRRLRGAEQRLRQVAGMESWIDAPQGE